MSTTEERLLATALRIEAKIAVLGRIATIYGDALRAISVSRDEKDAREIATEALHRVVDTAQGKE